MKKRNVTKLLMGVALAVILAITLVGMTASAKTDPPTGGVILQLLK